MLANIKNSQHGLTIVELLITITLIGLLIGPVLGGMFYFYGGTVANNRRASLGLEAQTILRAISQELLVSAGVRSQGTIDDPNKPDTWQTSNADLVMIIATPALDNNNDFIMDTATGKPYLNELVYYADGSSLYKRTLAHPDAAGNGVATSCTQNASTASCGTGYPDDKILSEDFKNMNFTFYDQDNVVITSNLANARSIEMFITMEGRAFGSTITLQNDYRVTLRNSLL